MKIRENNGFTLVELLVVITIILMLMALVMAVSPSSEHAVTVARLQRISSGVTTYHEHFQAYPRSYHYDMPSLVDVTGDYTWPDPVAGTARSGPLSEVLMSKGLRRRDLKYIDQMHVVNDSVNEVDVDTSTGYQYFIDGWNNRFVYYSGSEIHESSSIVNRPDLMAKWLKATGAYDLNTAATEITDSRGMHNPNDYYFLMSAGDDSYFSLGVLPSGLGDRYDPNNYEAVDLVVDGLVPDMNLYSGYEGDNDISTFSLRK